MTTRRHPDPLGRCCPGPGTSCGYDPDWPWPERPGANPDGLICVKDEFAACACPDCGWSRYAGEVAALMAAAYPDTPVLPEPDPAAEVLDALREFDTWLTSGPHYPDELSLRPDQAPRGMCRDCHLGAAVTSGRCFWCQLAVTVKNKNKDIAYRAGHSPGHVPCPCRGCRRRTLVSGLALAALAWVAFTAFTLAVTGNLHLGG